MPNLDGTVAPLPASKIDLADSQLVEALSAVSRISESTGQTATAVKGIRVAVSAPVPETRTGGLPAPVAVAEPVPPPLAAEPVAPVADHSGEARTQAPIPELFLDVESPAEEQLPRRGRRRAQLAPELKIAAVALIAIAIFVAGFLAGRVSHRRSSTPSPAGASSVIPHEFPAVGAVAVAATAPQEAPAPDGLSGRVVYLPASGPARPDSGARVFALPVQRPAGLPLETSGFRAGAVPTHRDRATASLRTAGGDYAIADGAGRFALQLAAGKYDLLFLSRHQSRDAAQSLPADIDALLSAFFDQPAGLVGSIAVEHQQVDFAGGALPLGCEFVR